MTGSRRRARRSAVQALYQWDITGQGPGDIESHFITDDELRGTDAEYFRRLIREIPRRSEHITDRIKPCLDRAIEGVDPVERAILRIGAYELEFEPEVPLGVVIDEAVELAKVFAGKHGYRFVNGVLDKLGRTLRPADQKQENG